MTSYILVPLDGSSLAEAALPSATALARATASTLILLRVVPPLTMIEPMGGAVYPGDAFWDAYEHEPEVAREYVSKVAANLRQDGIAVQTRVAYGEPAACILEHISAFPTINYVAMGTHGRSGLGRIFFGSVAEKVLRLSTVPVLLVRSGRDVAMQAEMEQAKRTFKHILVPLDGSELAEHGIQQARRLALDTDADITLLAVVPNPSVREYPDAELMPLLDESQEDLAKQLQQYLLGIATKLRDEGIKTRTQVNGGDPADQIIAESELEHIDLIIMGTHGLGGLQRMWLGSVALTVVQHTNKPVMLVRVGKPLEQKRSAGSEKSKTSAGSAK